MNNATDLRGAGIGHRNDLDQLRAIDRLRFRSGKQGIDIDTPFRHQPQQNLNTKDGPKIDVGPFWALDVGVVELRREVNRREERPNDNERPNIGVQLQRERIEQRRTLNLGIVNELRPVGLSATVLKRTRRRFSHILPLEACRCRSVTA